MISLAHAQAAGASADPTGSLMQFLPMILMFAVLWFLMVRPQMKKAKEHKALIAALAKGDEVVAGGGIMGRVSRITDQYVYVEIATGVEVQMQRQAVAQVLPKGSLK